MCSIELGLAGAAAGLAAGGAIYESQAEADTVRAVADLRERAATFEGAALAAAGETEARQLETEALRTEQLGEVEVAEIRRRNRIALGQQRVDLAAAGRDVSSGSAVVLAAESARRGELDVLKSRTNTMLRTEVLRTGARFRRAEARDALTGSRIAAAGERVRRDAAKDIETAGFIRAGTSLLRGGGRIAALA